MWKDYEFESGHNLLVGPNPGDYCLLDRHWPSVTSEELGAGFHPDASEEFKSAVWADYWQAQGDFEPSEVPE